MTCFAVLNVIPGSAVSACIKMEILPIKVEKPGYKTVSSADVCKEKLIAGLCLAQKLTVNLVWFLKVNAVHDALTTHVKLT